MTQAMEKPVLNDARAPEKRIEELESVLRTVLEQINTHQIYDKDARSLIRRVLGSASTTDASSTPRPSAKRQGEFPSLFPTASSSNFI